MPLRIYMAPQIGSGSMLSPDPRTWSDTTGPYRSLLNQYVDGANGTFDEIDHPAWLKSICTVETSASVLDAIEADSRITAVTPLRATDRTHLGQILSAPFSSYPLAWRNAARTFLENHGVNTEWITGSHTMRDVLRHIIKTFAVFQIAHGNYQANVLNFVKNNLDTQVSAIPLAQRQAVGNWLQSKGIDTSWITGTTTVRQVVATLPAQFATLYGRSVLLRFAGEDF